MSSLLSILISSMSGKKAIFTSQAPALFPVFSQAIVRNDTVYCSGMVGLDENNTIVSGGVASQTVCHIRFLPVYYMVAQLPLQDQLLRNLALILEEAQSGLQNILKLNVYLTSMDNFAAMNEAYIRHFSTPLPVCSENIFTRLVLLLTLAGKDLRSCEGAAAGCTSGNGMCSIHLN